MIFITGQDKENLSQIFDRYTKAGRGTTELRQAIKQDAHVLLDESYVDSDSEFFNRYSKAGRGTTELRQAIKQDAHMFRAEKICFTCVPSNTPFGTPHYYLHTYIKYMHTYTDKLMQASYLPCTQPCVPSNTPFGTRHHSMVEK